MASFVKYSLAVALVLMALSAAYGTQVAPGSYGGGSDYVPPPVDPYKPPTPVEPPYKPPTPVEPPYKPPTPVEPPYKPPTPVVPPYKPPTPVDPPYKPPSRPY